MPNFKGKSGGGPFKMNMKSYGQGKNPIQMSHGKSPAKGLFGKIGGAIKGAITGKDGKFGLADAGRLALGPAGMLMGAARGMKMTEKASGKSAMKMKGDLDKDGKMSGYETARQTAIEKNMKKSPSKMYGKKTPAKMYGKKTPAKMYGKKK